jgi:predicted TIM-barrel fold metal-dependent hydrolase
MNIRPIYGALCPAFPLFWPPAISPLKNLFPFIPPESFVSLSLITAMADPQCPVVDIHTHMYPPPYIDLLKARQSVPYIRAFSDDPADLRLVILPGEDSPANPSTSRGRPVGPEYWDVERKIAFMDQHRITKSVISLANPWLDFVDDADAAVDMAVRVNDWFEETCAKYAGRLYAFGVLPMKAGIDAIQAEIRRLKGLRWIRGVVMGTTGRGDGLDDAGFSGVWETLAQTGTMTFLHPHYGLPSDLYGPRNADYGHVLPLALGFPLETTIAITRMILAGVFSDLPELRVLVAHSGGALPFLAGRIQSCIEHDSHLKKAGHKPIDIPEILSRNIYLDAVIYSDIGLRTATQAVPEGRVLFGTDHPFFPPLKGQSKWPSVQTNVEAILKGLETSEAHRVLGSNAIELLNLT